MRRKSLCFLLILLIAANIMACNKSISTTEDTVGEGGKDVLNFYCFDLTETDNKILESAAKKFENEHPGMSVNIKDFEEQGYNIDRYLNTVNVELMSGKGPDIISGTYLPAVKYMEKNIFANLSEFMKEDTTFDQSKYFENVIEAGKYKGNLYLLPVYFNIRTVVASKEALDDMSIEINDDEWGLKDLISIAEKVTTDIDGNGVIDRYAFPKIDIQALVQMFIATENFVDYEHKTSYFNEDEFIELLELLEMFHKEKLTHTKLSIDKLISYKDSQVTVFNGGDIDGYRGLLGTKYRIGGGERVFLKMPSSTKQGRNTVYSKFMLGVNNHSKNKDYAWEFIKILMSDDYQRLYADASSIAGFPMNKEACDVQLRNVKMLDWRLKDSGSWIPVVLNEGDISFVKQYIENIDRITYYDTKIENIVMDEIGSLFKNKLSFRKKDAEDVARLIQNKVMLYLEE
ncbi:MAG: extracellular solute-binding protein [Firmicutes bacterium]|nr:extracellular solute-binding protein [Bacillota bacterium]